MTDSAWFAPHGAAFRPLELARSYWSGKALGGRAIVGLLGSEIERRHGAQGWVPARLTVDMFRLAPFEDITVHTRVVKEGSRLLLVEADLVASGEVVTRATCQFLRATVAPPGRVWSPGPWTAPDPQSLAPADTHPRSLEIRNVAGSFGGVTEKRCWMRETFPLVEGVPFTAFSRVAMAADYASPYAHAGDAGIRYINTDVTLHLHRVPDGEWIGFEATGHEASAGIAVGHCRLHDAAGAIGFASCTAVANEQRKLE